MFTVTVTAKSTEAPASSETPATTAPASADATTGVVATTEVPASANPLKAVSLSTKTPKVGDVITVVTEPVNASNIKSYKWFADAKEISGEASASYTVKKEDLGKVIKVVVTDKDNVEFTSNESAAVIEDNTQSVTLSVPKGLQADNTALSTDNIELTYGSGLGKLQDITWYCNDKFIRMTNFNAGRIFPEDLIWDTNPSVNGQVPSGTVYVVITNQEGKTFKSNTLEVVDNELPAKITNVTIEEDYSDARHVTFGDQTAMYVISATLNKDYDGTFSVIPTSATEVTKGNLVLEGGTAKLVDTAATAGKLLDSTNKITKDVMNAKSYMHDERVTTHGAKDLNGDSDTNDEGEATAGDVTGTGLKAYKFVNADKTVTYMFGIKAALKRGTDYKLVFEQTKVDASKLNDKDNKNAILSDKVTAPYVKAPGSIKITSVSKLMNSVEAKLYVGSSDAVAEYISTDTIPAKVVKFWSNEKYDTTSGVAATGGDAGTVVVTKGVAKIDVANDDARKIATYATFDAGAGIFGKEKFSLTSAYQIVPTTEGAQITVQTVKDSANNIFVDLAGQRCAGTVTLWKASTTRTNFNTVTNDEAKAIMVDSKKVGSSEVKLGDGGVTFKDAIKNFTTTNTNELFVARFVPADSAYADSVTDAKGGNKNVGLVVTPVATTFSMDPITTKLETKLIAGANTPDDDNDDVTGKKYITTSGSLVVKDQFGNALTNGLATELTGLGVEFDGDAKTTSDAGLALVVSNTGAVTLKYGNNKPVVATDAWSLTTSYGTYHVTVKTAGNTGYANGEDPSSAGAPAAADATAVFNITFEAKTK